MFSIKMSNLWNYWESQHEPINTWNVDNFSSKEQQRTVEETQSWIENLRSSTIDSSLYSASTKSDLKMEEAWLKYEKDIHTFSWFLATLDQLLEEIEEIKKWMSKKWIQSSWKETMKSAKQKLKQYEKQIKTKKRALLKQKNAQIYETDINHVKKLKSDIDAVRHDVSLWQWWEFSSNASYMYNSPENAKASNKRQAETLEFNQKIQEELKKWAILRIFNWSTQKANDFYRRIAQWEYYKADYQLFVANSTTLTPSFQRCGINIPTNPEWTIIEQWVKSSWSTWWKNVERSSKSTDYSNMDRWDTFKQWWVAGLLDKLLNNYSNMTPWQKNTRKSLWVLAWFWAWIFGLYKFYTNKKMWFWGKAWITAATIFGSEALTWKNPITLFQEFMTWWLSMPEIKNRYWDIVWWLSWNEKTNTTTTWLDTTTISVAPAMYSFMIFKSSTKVSDIYEMTQSFKTDNKNRETFYNQACNKLQQQYGTTATESFRAQFPNHFDQKKRESRLASFWITESANKNTSVYELANNATMNKTTITNFLENNKLKVTNDQTKKSEFENYVKEKNEKNEWIDIDDLKPHINERFIPIQAESQPKSEAQKSSSIQPNKNIEINSNNVQTSVEKWLSTIFNHFKSKYWDKIKKIKISEKNIPNFSPWITKDIQSKILAVKGKDITLDLSDNNIKYVYDNAVEKLASSQSWALNAITFWGLSKVIRSYKRNWISSKLKNRWLEWEMTKYNERKSNMTFIFQSLFWEIIPYLESQWWNTKIVCNWQEYNNINDAVNALEILKI